jgi:hypothetical protein
MSRQIPIDTEIEGLAWRLLDGTANEDDQLRLESLLCDDPQAREIYMRCMRLHADLTMFFQCGEEKSQRNSQALPRSDATAPMPIADSPLAGDTPLASV